MEILYKNGKSETLDKRHFLASGGEGQVYSKGGKVFKIYLQQKNVIAERKINELAVLTSPYIVKPLELIYGSHNPKAPIGYTMNAVNNTVSLCQLFTKAYKDRTGITEKTIFNLVQELKAGIEHCHQNGILIVDLNELNFLCDSKTHKNIWFIDVDSYQTPSFPATAIMDSIRDRHSKKFSELTDWFSFAIISFQMMIGIHPYKGKHPKLSTMDERMNANVSVLNKDVSYPKICMPFSTIPKNYFEWYTRVFEKGERIPPLPDSGVFLVNVGPKIVVANNKSFKVEDLFDPYHQRVIGYENIGGKDIVILEDSLMINVQGGIKINWLRDTACALGASNKGNNIVAVCESAGKIKIQTIYPHLEDVPMDILIDSVFNVDGRVFVKCGDTIHEMQFLEVGGKIVPSIKTACNVMYQSTQTFPGCVVQNMLGNFFISLFPVSGSHYQLKLDELNGFKIIDAKYQNRVAVVVAAKGGTYSRFIFRFAKDFQTYDVRRVDNLQHNDINFVCLPSGVCVMVNENDFTEVFFNAVGDNRIRLVEDDYLSDKLIFNRDSTMLVAHEKKLQKISLV